MEGLKIVQVTPDSEYNPSTQETTMCYAVRWTVNGQGPYVTKIPEAGFSASKALQAIEPTAQEILSLLTYKG